MPADKMKVIVSNIPKEKWNVIQSDIYTMLIMKGYNPEMITLEDESYKFSGYEFELLEG